MLLERIKSRPAPPFFGGPCAATPLAPYNTDAQSHFVLVTPSVKYCVHIWIKTMTLFCIEYGRG
jgi:hypothetical protein